MPTREVTARAGLTWRQLPGSASARLPAGLCGGGREGMSQRAMAERFGLSRRKVSQLAAQITASGNGHLPESETA